MSALRAWFGRSTAAALCIATVVACGGRSTDGASTDLASSDTPDAAADAALPPGVAFMQGAIKCCEKGLGRSCCNAQEKDLGECVEFRGCTPAGSGISGKDVCTICCDGLGVIGRATLVDGKCVDDSFPDDGAICAACGDGVCNATAGENVCNCPADCGNP